MVATLLPFESVTVTGECAETHEIGELLSWLEYCTLLAELKAVVDVAMKLYGWA
jgi:hypothetical protein